MKAIHNSIIRLSFLHTELCQRSLKSKMKAIHNYVSLAIIRRIDCVKDR